MPARQSAPLAREFCKVSACFIFNSQCGHALTVLRSLKVILNFRAHAARLVRSRSQASSTSTISPILQSRDVTPATIVADVSHLFGVAGVANPAPRVFSNGTAGPAAVVLSLLVSFPLGGGLRAGAGLSTLPRMIGKPSLLRCVSPLMAQSGHPDMSAYLSLSESCGSSRDTRLGSWTRSRTVAGLLSPAASVSPLKFSPAAVQVQQHQKPDRNKTV